MTALPPLVPPDVVGRLRAAGCVFAEDEARLLVADARTPDALELMVRRRMDGEPLEYILGWAEFCGLRIAVDQGVFVPRRRTRFLVRQAVELATPDSLVLDLCCGSGAVGIAVASRVPGIDLFAADIDPAAVRCARRNFTGFAHLLYGTDVAETTPAVDRVFAGDLFAPLPEVLRGRVDLLVVNAPYVPTDEIARMPPEARDHEARLALDGGADGLDIHRRVAAAAPGWLASHGHLLIETSKGQAAATKDILAKNGFTATVARSNKRDATVVIGVVGPTAR